MGTSSIRFTPLEPGKPSSPYRLAYEQNKNAEFPQDSELDKLAHRVLRVHLRVMERLPNCIVILTDRWLAPGDRKRFVYELQKGLRHA